MVGTYSARNTERWIRTTRHNPCPICGEHGFCMRSPDGAIAGCMKVGEGAFRTTPTAVGDMYLHRGTDEPRELPPPRPATSETLQRNVIADRAVYAFVLETCAALPDFAVAELVRRFGPDGPALAARFRIGYCDGPALVAALERAGRRRDAIAAEVLDKKGKIAHALRGRLVIPYLRDGQVHDLRGAGIKGRDTLGTKELSLRGGYAAHEVADLFFNHEALGQLDAGGTLHLAGGAYKTMALAAAGLAAAGLRGEGELTAGHIAALLAAGVRTIVRHIDAEDPKAGQDLSAGRRLGLQVAERLVAAGIEVLIAEPHREPGTAKVDPDALYRDYGPRLVRAYACSAVPLAAWRVVIGVAEVGVPAAIAEELAKAKMLRDKATRTLGDVMQIRRNAAIKAERDTLVASVLHMHAERANGRVTPDGWIRQPLYTIAETVGVARQTASNHMRLGPENDLFDRDVFKEVVVRDVDVATGERRNTLRQIDQRGQIVEECPAEFVFGPGGQPPQRASEGDDGGRASYVRPHHETEALIGLLVTLAPVKTKRDGTEQVGWGGRREPCPRCGSQRRRTIVSCADCDLEISNRVSEPQEPTEETVADITPRVGPPVSIPPTPVLVPPVAYAATADGPVHVAEERADPDDAADDWDPYECNHPGCTRRPVIGQRWCGVHRAERRRLAAETPPPDPPPLDPALAHDLARRHDPAAIAARLAGLRARWEEGEQTAALRLLLAEWRQIATAREALDRLR